MDMSDYEELSSYLSPSANSDFGNDDFADVMINRYFQ